MNNSTRYYSDKQEKRTAKYLGGKQVSNSGAAKFVAGDVELDDWLIECKTVTKEQKTFTIKKEWLEKNKEEAFQMGKHYSALAFDFGDFGDRYYVVDEKTFLEMKGGLENEENHN